MTRNDRRYCALVAPGPSQSTPPTQNSLDAVAPLICLLAVHRVAGLRWAVAAATVASVVVVVRRRRQGTPLGRFMPLITIAVIARGVIGIITNSEAVYFGLGIAAKYAGSLTLAVSVVAGRPLAAYLAPKIMEVNETTGKHARFHRAMRMTTLVAALYYFLSASFDWWLYQRSSVEGYVVVRFLASWPLSIAAISVIALILQRELQRIPGVESVASLIESRLAAASSTHQ